MPDLSAGAEIGGYRIEAMVGRGGMGVVYRAVDLALDRRVAIKLISAENAQEPGFRERFKRESRLAASIRHPNVITVFRAGEEDGQLFIAMDYIEGTDLKALITSRGRLDPELAARIVVQVAAALDAAHAKGLVHRDVKPANVLIEGAERAYLTDFGLTKEVASESGVTGTGVVLGTIDYMAPEQVAGDKLDARADIYSLGCVLWEALTGQVPYLRESAVAMGMTSGQMLRQVQLPLAAPTILAGIRVATVTTIGTATIAAAIGGGGLGVFIFRGVASVDTAQILAGAVPAALIALAADGGLGWVERKLSRA